MPCRVRGGPFRRGVARAVALRRPPASADLAPDSPARISSFGTHTPARRLTLSTRRGHGNRHRSSRRGRARPPGSAHVRADRGAARHPEPDPDPAHLLRLVQARGPARALRGDLADLRLHRQDDGAALPGLRVRRAALLRDRMPRARYDLRRAAARQGRTAHQGDGRDQGVGDLHGRLPHDDRRRHLRHQRRRARRRLPARALARRLLHAGQGPEHRPRPLLGQADPEPRRLAGVRDAQPRRAVGQGRPQAQDPGDDPAAGDRLRHATSNCSICSPTSTPTRSTATSRRRSTASRPRARTRR